MNKSSIIKSIFLYILSILFSLISITFISKSVGLTELNTQVILNKTFIILAFYLLFRIQKVDFFRYIRSNKINRKDFIPIITSSFSISILVLGIVFFSLVKLAHLNPTEIIKRYDLLSTLMFSTIIIAPITEEIVFRGIIFNKLKEGFSRRSSLYIQAFLFALIHVNPLQVVYTFIFGIFLGKIYEKTDSIFGVILSHMIINFVGSYGISWFFYNILN